MGLWGIWLLVINGFVGAGIFGLPSGAYALAGEYSVWIYVVCALLVLLGILACHWLMLQVSFNSIWLTALFIIIGTGLYWLGRKQKKV